MRAGDSTFNNFPFVINYSKFPILFILENISDDDIVLIDDYSTSSIDIEPIKKYLTIEINDLPEKAIGCRRLINHLPGADKSLFSHLTNTELFLGIEFLLLRTEFINAISIDKYTEKRKGITMFFGGTDPSNIASKYINEGLKLEDEDIHLITSSKNTQISLLSEILNQNPKFHLYIDISPSEIIELIQKTRICISTASSFCLEALCCKTLLVVGYTHNNQRLIAKSIETNHIGINIGNFSLSNYETILKRIALLKYNEIIHNQKRLLKNVNQKKLLEVFDN